MGIFALGLAFDAGQTVRPASVTLRGHQLHDLSGHDKIGVLVVEYDGKYCQGQDCEDPAAMSLSSWTGQHRAQYAVSALAPANIGGLDKMKHKF